MNASNNFEIRKSKHGEYIPVVNGVFIHSAYNPIREAESFVENHLSTLRQKNNILVLGLGIAYHIDQMLHHLNNFHSQYRLVVIEPMKSMAEACKEFNPQSLKKIILLTGKDVTDLYQDPNFIRFLMNKPGVIAHPASLNLHAEYFRELLSYEADQSLRAFAARMPANLIPYFNQFSPNTNLDTIFQQLEVKTKLEQPADYLLAALASWTQGQMPESLNEKHTDC
ncbi:MAG: hypothetical protein ACOYL6_04805 [Bacteriovoracaceae bacterium]